MNKISKHDIAQSFSQAALSYDDAAFFQKIAGERLLERLEYFKLSPQTIVDVGCGTGYFTRQLSQKFPQASVTGVDLAQGMIDFCQSQSTSENYLCADACQLPFADNSVDFVFSNLTFQWVDDLTNLFNEINRVIKPNGLLLFTTLGPDTLFELKQSWAQIDDYQHVNQFIDMHHVGDAMLSAQMIDPVMDSEPVVLSYSKVIELMRDLKNIGAHNIDQKRSTGLTSPRKLKQVEKNYQQFALEDGQLPVTYELVYGHAFASDKKAPKDYHEYILELAKEA